MPSQIGRMVVGGFLCLGIAGGASDLLGARRYGAGTPWPKKKTTAQTQPTTAPVAPTTAPVVDDSVARAQAAMLAAEAKAKKKFESMPEWTTAEGVVSKAQADAQAAISSVVSSVRKQPDYIAAADEVSSDETKLQQARENGGDSSEVSSAASALMAARSALSSLQNRASGADPAVVASREKLTNANLAIEQLRKREVAFVQADSDWVLARKAYDEARTKVASAVK